MLEEVVECGRVGRDGIYYPNPSLSPPHLILYPLPTIAPTSQASAYSGLEFFFGAFTYRSLTGCL